MKILVIGHSDIYSAYGAATSLRNHFKCLSDVETLCFSHVYRKGIRQKNKGTNFPLQKNLQNLESMWLPIDGNAYTHTSPGFWKNVYGVVFPNFLARIFKYQFIRYLESSGADLIHLNSIVLWPIIEIIRKIPKLRNVKIIMHVRELWDKNRLLLAAKSLKFVDRFVFIDEAVKNRMMEHLPDLLKIIPTVIQNPFESNAIVDEKVGTLFNKNECNFAIAGIIGEDKGVEFICKSYSKSRPQNSRLFVIGKRNKLSQKLKKQYASVEINFTDEINNMGERGAFSFIDCIIRGERIFCTGRSTYEALYAGGFAIIPGNSSDVENDKELCKFKERIFFYKPRDEVSFQAALNFAKEKILIKKKGHEQSPALSNHLEYKNAMMKLYENTQAN